VDNWPSSPSEGLGRAGGWVDMCWNDVVADKL
jgi:hypothetical protein